MNNKRIKEIEKQLISEFDCFLLEKDRLELLYGEVFIQCDKNLVDCNFRSDENHIHVSPIVFNLLKDHLTNQMYS